MKKVSTKKVVYFLAAMGAASFMTITGCKKGNSPTTDPVVKTNAQSKISMDDFVSDLKKIKTLGFDPSSVQITPDGYRVEGDIRLTRQNINESFATLSQQQGQYSTRYPLAVIRTINVALYDKSNVAKFSIAFDSTVVDLNNLKLPLKFVRITDTTKADIVIVFKDLGPAGLAPMV
jgi:hypothetical protein